VIIFCDLAKRSKEKGEKEVFDHLLSLLSLFSFDLLAMKIIIKGMTGKGVIDHFEFRTLLVYLISPFILLAN